jgi:O-methyltransferase
MIKWIEKTYGLSKLRRIDRDLARFTRQLKLDQYTFLSYLQLANLAENFVRLSRSSSTGIQTAEFGVGRGGSAMLLAWLVDRYGGSLDLYDVFARIPAPSAEDGQKAQNRYQDILKEETSNYYGNIPDLITVIKTELSAICSLEKVCFHQGMYEELLPRVTDSKRFHLVHVDCDWYESARAVFHYLRNRLADNAVLQIDDYFYWQGAKKATDEAVWLHNYTQRQIGGALLIDLGQPVK